MFWYAKVTYKGLGLNLTPSESKTPMSHSPALNPLSEETETRDLQGQVQNPKVKNRLRKIDSIYLLREGLIV